MKFYNTVIAGVLAASLQSASADELQSASWKSEGYWNHMTKMNQQFFDKNAFKDYGSYATYLSELEQDGTPKNDLIHIVAISRLVYGNSRAIAPNKNIHRARKVSRFVEQFMQDEVSRVKEIRGEYSPENTPIFFYPHVKADGSRGAENERPQMMFTFHGAYPLTGLLALYQNDFRELDLEEESKLLSRIRRAYDGFNEIFYDQENGGYFYYYNFSKRDHTNTWAGEEHKSYQSLVYPISSFLLDLRNADKKYQTKYDARIIELADLAIEHIIEKDSNGVPTGWLLESFDRNFKVNESYTMSEGGHMTQLAWVLQAIVDQGIVEGKKAEEYSYFAKTLVQKFVELGGINQELGGIYNAFNRTNGEILGFQDRLTMSWWSNMEALIAFGFAYKYEWLDRQVVDGILQGIKSVYLNHFWDAEFGGEIANIYADDGSIQDATKGNPGKSGYHSLEAFLYLRKLGLLRAEF